MFGPKEGSWSVDSESDPRWNGHGRTGAWYVTAGTPPEAGAHIKACEQKFGKQPKDLTYSFMKD